MFLTLVTTTTGFAIGLYYPSKVNLSTPQPGFISISVGWALSIVSIALFVASLFCGGNGNFARFQDEPAGSMSTNIGREKGCFVLNGSGQLKWRSADSIPSLKSQEQNDNKANNDVDVEAGDFKPDHSTRDTENQKQTER